MYHAFKGPQAQANPKQWCYDHFLNYRSLQQADNVRQQIKTIMERQDLELISTPFEDKKYYENIRRALVSGFFMQVAKKDSSNKNYITVDNQNVIVGHNFSPRAGIMLTFDQDTPFDCPARSKRLACLQRIRLDKQELHSHCD